MIARTEEAIAQSSPEGQSLQQDEPGNERLYKQVDTPVFIVGAGPSGLLQAYLLSRLGGELRLSLSDKLMLSSTVRCTMIEGYAQRLAAPKAHALSPRTLEICRQFHLDTHKIRQLGTPRADAYWVNFVTNLSGEKVGKLPYERMDVDVLDDTPMVRGDKAPCSLLNSFRSLDDSQHSTANIRTIRPRRPVFRGRHNHEEHIVGVMQTRQRSRIHNSRRQEHRRHLRGTLTTCHRLRWGS